MAFHLPTLGLQHPLVHLMSPAVQPLELILIRWRFIIHVVLIIIVVVIVTLAWTYIVIVIPDATPIARSGRGRSTSAGSTDGG